MVWRARHGTVRYRPVRGTALYKAQTRYQHTYINIPEALTPNLKLAHSHDTKGRPIEDVARLNDGPTVLQLGNYEAIAPSRWPWNRKNACNSQGEVLRYLQRSAASSTDDGPTITRYINTMAGFVPELPRTL